MIYLISNIFPELIIKYGLSLSLHLTYVEKWPNEIRNTWYAENLKKQCFC